MTRYDATPSGRILSRYTADLGVVDTQISLYVDNAVQMVLLCLASPNPPNPNPNRIPNPDPNQVLLCLGLGSTVRVS